MDIERIKKAYLVSNVPWYLYIPYIIVSAMVGACTAAWYFLVYATSSIIIEGQDHRRLATPAVYALWHEHSLVNIAGTCGWPNVEMLNHPFWYMKHVHICLWLLGHKKMHLGSTGTGGREAASSLVRAMHADPRISTFINPDGPEGPYHELRKGGFHIARESGRPVIAVSLAVWPTLRLGGWDKKYFPMPFSTIYMRFGEPQFVTSDNFDQAMELVRADLMKPIFTLKKSQSSSDLRDKNTSVSLLK